MNLDWFGRGSAVTSASAALHMSQQPLFIQVITRLMFILMVLSVFSLLFVPWQQTSNGYGQLIAYDPVEREQAIEAPVKGRVVRWHVKEGDKVKKGDVLVEIADNDPDYLKRLGEQRDAVVAQRDASKVASEQIEAQLASLKEVKRLTLSSMDSKIKMANNEVDAARLELKATEGAKKAANLNLERKTALAEQGLTSQRELELAEMKFTKEDAYVSKGRAKLLEKQSKVLALRAERESKSSDIDAKIAEVSAKYQSEMSKLAKASESLSKAEVNLARQNQMIVTAPRDGIIWRVSAFEGGEVVKEGEQLALIVPQIRARSVELWIDGNDAPLVYEGREVQMQFEGYPALMFRGFPEMSMGTFSGVVAFVDARADTSGRFRVLVNPHPNKIDWPSPDFLRPGARVNAWIQLNQVSLGYELWRQLNGFPIMLPDDKLEELTGGKKESKKGKKK
jgi:multidrug resistance efflux pump